MRTISEHSGNARAVSDRVKTWGTPKQSGFNRRFGRPLGELSSFHVAISSIFVLAVFALIVIVLILMKPTP